MHAPRRLSFAAAAIAVLVSASVLAQNEGVPRDLKPLLAKPVSEMRLVVTRYNADRQTLNGNYAGPGGFNMPGGRGGGGRGAAARPAKRAAAGAGARALCRSRRRGSRG